MAGGLATRFFGHVPDDDATPGLPARTLPDRAWAMMTDRRSLPGLKAILAFMVIAIVVLGAGFAPKAFAQSGESVRVRAGMQAEQGRLVFDWQSPVGYEARIDGRQLTITFARRANFDLSTVTGALNGYVTSSALADDGRTLRFQLAGDFRLSRWLNGSAVVVDLLGPPVRSSAPATAPAPPPVVTAPIAPQAAPPAQSATAPAAPAPAAPIPLRPRTQAAPAVNNLASSGDVILQVGQQQAFTRLSFIWPQPPPTYSVTKSGNAISVVFDRLTQIDVGKAETEPPRGVRDVRVFNRTGKTSVVFTVDPGTTFRNFAEDRTVVVDLISGRASSNPSPVEPEVKQITSDDKARSDLASRNPALGANNFDPDSGPLPERLTTPALAQAQRADAEKRALAQIEKANPGAMAQQAAANAVASNPAPASPAAPSPARPNANANEPTASAAPRFPVTSQPLPATPLGSVGTVVVTPETLADRTRIMFPFPVKTPVAAFTRAGLIWVVFDAQANLDLKAVAQPPLKVRQTPTPRGTVVNMDLPEGRGIEVGSQDNTWWVDVLAQPTRGEPVEIVPRPNKPGGSDVLVQIRDRGDIQRLSDPVVGDKFDVATTLRPNHGLGSLHNFLGFDLWPTQQGAVIIPLMDSIQTTPDPEGVAITVDGGLMLSNGTRPTEQAMKGAGGSPGAEGFIEYDKWARQAEGPFKRIRARLERNTALAPKSLKNAARLELARFFLANHFDAEALGVLNLMASTDDTLLSDPAFRAMRGVAKIGMYRPKEALEDLSVPTLQLDNNTAFWRGMANTMTQDWSGAAAEFRRAFPLIDRYPVKERLKFRMASARANIELGDKEAAAKDLSDIVSRKPQPPEAFRVYYLGGRLRELNNDLSGALADYDRTIAGSDRQSKANARYRKILLQEKAGKITPAGAIEELETLRYTWRGDDLERDILRSLGLYYIKSGDFRAGFDTMRQAMTMFADSRQAQEIKEDMNRVFSDLFLRGAANSMSPVKALGLYYDFRELTPIGNDGDEMIRRLADRMVSVDLLSQASELLRHQVDKRLAGTAQAQVATRLAVVYLLDKKPAEAVQVLEKTQQIQLPLALANERIRIKARAQMELGRTVEALTSLNDDKGQDAQFLRADILWSGQRWAEAGAKIEELLNPVKGADAKIDPISQSLVLRAAISFALAGDRAGLSRLTSTFGPRMAKSTDAQSFIALTNSPDIANTDFRELAGKIASTKTYESFLTAYRERIRSGGLNAIN